MPEILRTLLPYVEFGSPDYLMFVPVAAAFAVLGVLIHILKLRRRPARTHGSTYPFVGPIKLWFVSTLVLALAAVAAARPFFIFGASNFKRGTVDVPIVIDASASMWVKDLGSSRLEIAIREALALEVSGILQPGDRAALFVFGGTAARKVHLSTNMERLVDVMAKLKPPETLTGDSFPWDSDIAGAFEHIYQALDNQDRFESGNKDWQPTRRADRSVILLSDGDFSATPEQAQRLDVALAEFRRRGLVAYPIGIGTRTGARLAGVLDSYKPGRDYDAALAADLEDQQTQLNVDSLRLLAQRTGGKTFVIDSSRVSATGFLRQAVDAHRTVSFRAIQDDRKQEVWMYVVAAAILLFALVVLFY